MHPLGFRSVASLNNLTQPWRTLCPIWQFAAYAAFCFLQMARPHTNVLKFCKPKYAKNRRCYRYTQCYRYKIMATIYRRCRRCFLFRFTPFYAFFPFLLREQLSNSSIIVHYILCCQILLLCLLLNSAPATIPCMLVD